MSNDRGLPQPPTRSSPGTFSGLPQTPSQCPQTPTSPRFCGPWTLPTPKPTEPSCHRHPRDPLLVRAQPCQGPEERRSLQRQGGKGWGRPLLSCLGLAPPHLSRPRVHSPSPLAASGLSWGSSPGWQTWRCPPARVEDRISETLLSSALSPPADLTLVLGHWSEHSAATSGVPWCSRGVGTWGQWPGLPKPVSWSGKCR